MISMQQAALESRMDKIARMLAEQHDGVRVVVGGTGIYVDLSTCTIHLPSVAHAVLEGIDLCFDGMCDHEVAHVRHTDRKVMERDKPTGLFRGLCNVADDAHVERRLGAEFRGCKQNMDRLTRALHAKTVREWEKLPATERLLSALDMCWRRAFRR